MTANRVTPSSLLAQVGGVSGLIYSSLPVVTFVAISSAAGLLPAIVARAGRGRAGVAVAADSAGIRAAGDRPDSWASASAR